MSRKKLNLGDKLMFDVRDQLKEMGYLVEYAKKVRFQRQDFFGCWDLIAMNPVLGNIRFIQVSANTWTKRELAYRQKLLDFPLINDHCTKEYWYWNKTTEIWETRDL